MQNIIYGISNKLVINYGISNKFEVVIVLHIYINIERE